MSYFDLSTENNSARLTAFKIALACILNGDKEAASVSSPQFLAQLAKALTLRSAARPSDPNSIKSLQDARKELADKCPVKIDPAIRTLAVAILNNTDRNTLIPLLLNALFTASSDPFTMQIVTNLTTEQPSLFEIITVDELYRSRDNKGSTLIDQLCPTSIELLIEVLSHITNLICEQNESTRPISDDDFLKFYLLFTRLSIFRSNKAIDQTLHRLIKQIYSKIETLQFDLTNSGIINLIKMLYYFESDVESRFQYTENDYEVFCGSIEHLLSLLPLIPRLNTIKYMGNQQARVYENSPSANTYILITHSLMHYARYILKVINESLQSDSVNRFRNITSQLLRLTAEMIDHFYSENQKQQFFWPTSLLAELTSSLAIIVCLQSENDPTQDDELVNDFLNLRQKIVQKMQLYVRISVGDSQDESIDVLQEYKKSEEDFLHRNDIKEIYRREFLSDQHGRMFNKHFRRILNSLEVSIDFYVIAINAASAICERLAEADLPEVFDDKLLTFASVIKDIMESDDEQLSLEANNLIVDCAHPKIVQDINKIVEKEHSYTLEQLLNLSTLLILLKDTYTKEDDQIRFLELTQRVISLCLKIIQYTDTIIDIPILRALIVNMLHILSHIAFFDRDRKSNVQLILLKLLDLSLFTDLELIMAAPKILGGMIADEPKGQDEFERYVICFLKELANIAINYPLIAKYMLNELLKNYLIISDYTFEFFFPQKRSMADLLVLVGDAESLKKLAREQLFRKSVDDDSVFHIAARLGDLESLKNLYTLINKTTSPRNAIINEKNKFNLTPLDEAYVNGHHHIIKWFEDLGYKRTIASARSPANNAFFWTANTVKRHLYQPWIAPDYLPWVLLFPQIIDNNTLTADIIITTELAPIIHSKLIDKSLAPASLINKRLNLSREQQAQLLQYVESITTKVAAWVASHDKGESRAEQYILQEYQQTLIFLLEDTESIDNNILVKKEELFDAFQGTDRHSILLKAILLYILETGSLYFRNLRVDHITALLQHNARDAILYAYQLKASMDSSIQGQLAIETAIKQLLPDYEALDETILTETSCMADSFASILKNGTINSQFEAKLLAAFISDDKESEILQEHEQTALFNQAVLTGSHLVSALLIKAPSAEKTPQLHRIIYSRRPIDSNQVKNLATELVANSQLIRTEAMRFYLANMPRYEKRTYALLPGLHYFLRWPGNEKILTFLFGDNASDVEISIPATTLCAASIKPKRMKNLLKEDFILLDRSSVSTLYWMVHLPFGLRILAHLLANNPGLYQQFTLDALYGFKHDLENEDHFLSTAAALTETDIGYEILYKIYGEKALSFTNLLGESEQELSERLLLIVYLFITLEEDAATFCKDSTIHFQLKLAYSGCLSFAEKHSFATSFMSNNAPLLSLIRVFVLLAGHSLPNWVQDVEIITQHTRLIEQVKTEILFLSSSCNQLLFDNNYNQSSMRIRDTRIFQIIFTLNAQIHRHFNMLPELLSFSDLDFLNSNRKALTDYCTAFIEMIIELIRLSQDSRFFCHETDTVLETTWVMLEHVIHLQFLSQENSPDLSEKIRGYLVKAFPSYEFPIQSTVENFFEEIGDFFKREFFFEKLLAWFKADRLAHKQYGQKVGFIATFREVCKLLRCESPENFFIIHSMANLCEHVENAAFAEKFTDYFTVLGSIFISNLGNLKLPPNNLFDAAEKWVVSCVKKVIDESYNYSLTHLLNLTAFLLQFRRKLTAHGKTLSISTDFAKRLLSFIKNNLNGPPDIIRKISLNLVTIYYPGATDSTIYYHVSLLHYALCKRNDMPLLIDRTSSCCQYNQSSEQTPSWGVLNELLNGEPGPITVKLNKLGALYKELSEAYPDVILPDGGGWLELLILLRHSDGIRELADKKVNFCAKNKNGRGILHILAMLDDTGPLNQLWGILSYEDRETLLSMKDVDGFTAQQLAAAHKNLNILASLNKFARSKNKVSAPTGTVRSVFIKNLCSPWLQSTFIPFVIVMEEPPEDYMFIDRLSLDEATAKLIAARYKKLNPFILVGKSWPLFEQQKKLICSHLRQTLSKITNRNEKLTLSLNVQFITSLMPEIIASYSDAEIETISADILRDSISPEKPKAVLDAELRSSIMVLHKKDIEQLQPDIRNIIASTITDALCLNLFINNGANEIIGIKRLVENRTNNSAEILFRGLNQSSVLGKQLYSKISLLRSDKQNTVLRKILDLLKGVYQTKLDGLTEEIIYNLYSTCRLKIALLTTLDLASSSSEDLDNYLNLNDLPASLPLPQEPAKKALTLFFSNLGFIGNEESQIAGDRAGFFRLGYVLKQLCDEIEKLDTSEKNKYNIMYMFIEFQITFLQSFDYNQSIPPEQTLQLEKRLASSRTALSYLHAKGN